MAYQALRKVGAEEWAVQQKRRYWKWAGHITRMSDDRWTVNVLNWLPAGGLRRPGHPDKRWRDDLDTFADSQAGRRSGKQLQYMIRHAGDLNIRDEEKTKRWNILWAKHEKAFLEQ